MPLLLTPRPLHPAGALPGDSAALLTLASRPQVLSGAGSPRGSRFPLPCCGCCRGGCRSAARLPAAGTQLAARLTGLRLPRLQVYLRKDVDGEDNKQEAASPHASGFCSPLDRGSPLEAVRPRARCREGVAEGLGLSKRGWGGFAQSPGVHEGVCPKKTGCSYRQGAQGLGFRVRRGLGTSSAWLCQEAGDDGVAGGPENLCCYLKKKKSRKKKKKKKDFSSSCG